MGAGTLRRIVLAEPIAGAPAPHHFRIEEAPLPAVADGQALIRTHCFSVDPGTRSRLSGAASYAAALKPGQVIDGFCVGEVIESKSPRCAAGDLVAVGGGWASHVLFPGRGYLQKISDARLPASLWIGVLGVPGMTAWFGLERVARLAAGERVLVTSAAGPVGATAGQIAKRHGAARVVGVAGGARKCAWITGEAGFDAAIDYKSADDLGAAIGAAMPEGIDILFDNVGAAMIEAAMPFMRPGGRIVASGQVADYNTPLADRPALRNIAPFITHRLRMEGLVVFDDLASFPRAQAQLADWIVHDRLAYREERFIGVDSAIDAFCGLFTGQSFGRRIILTE